MYKMGLISLLSIVLLLPVTTVANDYLEGDELKAVFNDVTFVGKHFKQGKGVAYWAPDGTYKCEFENGSKYTGTWWVEGTKRCVERSDGKKFCNRVTKNDDGSLKLYKANKNKEVCAVYKVIAGDEYDKHSF